MHCFKLSLRNLPDLICLDAVDNQTAKQQKLNGDSCGRNPVGCRHKDSHQRAAPISVSVMSPASIMETTKIKNAAIFSTFGLAVTYVTVLQSSNSNPVPTHSDRWDQFLWDISDRAKNMLVFGLQARPLEFHLFSGSSVPV
jgi:hypothetical protein